MSEVKLAEPTAADCDELLAAVAGSRELHGDWVQPPDAPQAYHAWLARFANQRHVGYFVRRIEDETLVGVINLNEIVRGCFCSCYLGYYALEPHAGQGYMRGGLQLAIKRAFGPLGLHRVEANIQPENAASIALVRRLGFRREGISPRYLKIAGAWRDHQRWALTVEDLASRGK